MGDSQERDAAFDGVPAVHSENQPESELAREDDLTKKAVSQPFSAAWGDDWNPNPLSDVSE
jgi:hypothetical protein